MIFEAQPYGLHPRDIEKVLQLLQNGGVGIVPTDSVYAFCCLSDQKSAFEKICTLKKIDPKEALMSIVCKDISQASSYFIQWPTPVFRILNKNLPGPFTIIMQSGNRAPAFLKNKRKTLGLRIPDHPVIRGIMEQSAIPLLVSSVKSNDDIEEYFSDINELTALYERQVDFIIIDETGLQEASTVVDMTGNEPEIIRQSGYELKM